MTDAWGYVRLSRTGREDSIEGQKAALREYAARREDLHLQTTLNEGSETSGFSADRAKYARLTDRIAEGSIGAVVVRDRARLSRDFDERLRLLTLFRESGVEWHVVEAGGPIDVGDIHTAGMECVHAAMDHVKKMAEIERSREATQDRIDSGCYQGTPPWGLQFAADKCHLERDPEAWPALQDIIDRREAGEPQRSIAEDVGVSTATVSRVVDRGLAWYEAKLNQYGQE